MNTTLTFTDTEDDTAKTTDSTSLPLLHTPRLLASCEAATCAADGPSLDQHSNSDGTPFALAHQCASPSRPESAVTASSSDVDGRLHRCTIAARHTTDQKVVATGEITRVVVDSERFLSRL